jgi:hypothetical protein
MRDAKHDFCPWAAVGLSPNMPATAVLPVEVTYGFSGISPAAALRAFALSTAPVSGLQHAVAFTRALLSMPGNLVYQYRQDGEADVALDPETQGSRPRGYL